MKFSRILVTLICFLIVMFSVKAQTDISSYSWKKVATQMPDEWYGTAAAAQIASTVLFAQQEIGGWAKNKPYHQLTKADSADILKTKNGIGATIDNGSTITEMIFLAKMFSQTKDETYKKSFLKGLDYLLEAQYDNGGWPQFYPYRKGSSVNYASHITYNDNAMVNVLLLLRDIRDDHSTYAALAIPSFTREKAAKAFAKGIDCILKTQIRVNGEPTVWCAQHDEITLAPAKARAYELPSFSGSESAAILQLLMEIPSPSEAIKTSVRGGLKWFREHQLNGIRLTSEINEEGKKNLVVVADPSAPPLWARFYDLETGKPFFCDRDGIKKTSLHEIGHERRNGYSWYVSSPAQVLARGEKWMK